MPSPAETPSPPYFGFARAGLLNLAAGALVILPAVVLPAAASSANPNLTSELRRAGLEPLQSAPAPHFSLPLLQGGEASLADYRGQWVLLTFFATWCGPCRAELPSLESLHQQAAGSGVLVVAVSVDDNKKLLPPFVKRLGLTFPVLWDERGEVGAAYRTSSIPVTFLVDPAGALIAVAHGARDWTRARGLVAALAGRQPEVAANGKVAPGGTPQIVPPVSADLPPPPELAAELLDAEPTVGCPFEVAVRVRLAGSANDYLLKPPALNLPAGLTSLGVSAASGGRQAGAGEEATEITYRLRLEANQVGRYDLGNVTLAYQVAGSTEEQRVEAAVPSVEVMPIMVAGQTVPRLLWGGLACLSLGAAVFAGLRLKARRERLARLAAAADPRIAPLQAALTCARRQRLEGRAVAEFLALAHAAKVLGVAGEEAEHLERALERARYGNQAPSEGELAVMRRNAERHLSELVRADEQKGEEKLKHSVLTPNLTPSAASLPARE